MKSKKEGLNEKKAIGSLLLASLVLISSNVFAYGGKSQAHIGYHDRGVNGNSITANGKGYLYCQNDQTSQHGLWSELYKSVAGPDRKVNSVYKYKYQSGGKHLRVSDGVYYVHLDVDGPGYTGNKGYGYYQDR